jgi:signal transduction histidine kinase/DNA-binding response OmpR family regulator/ligand-binding sensor domain-containing protein
MLRNLHLTGILILTLFITQLRAEQYWFKQLNSLNGLSHNTVYDIEQDNFGYMWLATREGLNRFDGYRNEIFIPENENSSERVSSDFRMVFHHSSGRIFANTIENLYYFDSSNNKLTKVNFPVSNGRIISLKELDKNHLLTLTPKGLFKLNVKDESSTQFFAGTVKDLTVLNDSSLYILTLFRGLLKIDSNGSILNNFRNFNRHFSSNEHNLLLGVNDSIAVLGGSTKPGFVIVNTLNGKYNYINRTTKSGEKLNFIRDMTRDNRGNIWFASEYGLFYYNILNDELTKISRSLSNSPFMVNDQSFYSLKMGRENILWAGTYFGGVYYSPFEYSFFERILPGISPNNLTGKAISQIIRFDKDNLLIATEDGGINSYNPETETINPFKPNLNQKAGNNIHALLRDSKNNLWIGAFENGLTQYNPSNGQISRFVYNPEDPAATPSISIYTLYEDSAKQIWIGGTNGIRIFDYKTGKLSAYNDDDFKNAFVYHIFDDHQGNILVCTMRNGFCVINSSRNTLKWYTPSTSKIPSSRCITGLCDNNGIVWLGFLDGGFVRFDPQNDSIKIFNTSDGLINNNVYGILEDNKNNLWISTNKGLSRFNKETETFINFTHEYGLPANQFNFRSAFRDDNGTMYFGSVNGIVRFNPEDILFVKKPSTLVFENFLIAERDVIFEKRNLKNVIYNPSDTIVLQYSQNTFSVKYSTINFVTPRGNHYTSYLKGFDKSPKNMGENTTATYTNIPFGKYELIITATNSDGLHLAQSKTLFIVVKPPIYLTKVAFALYFIIGIFLIFLTRKLIILRQREKHKFELIALEKEKNEELTKQKLNFFTNISHELKTPLTLILASVEKLKSNTQTDNNKNFTSIIHQNAERLLTLINQLIDFRRIETNRETINLQEGDIIRLLRDIFNGFVPLFNDKKLYYVFESDTAKLLSRFDGDKIQKIVSNLLTNAYSHSNENSPVSLYVTYKDGIVSMEFKNRGRFLTTDEIEKAFLLFESNTRRTNLSGSGIGLPLVKNLVVLLGGTITFTSTQTEGNIITVRIPVEKVSATGMPEQKSITTEEKATDFETFNTDTKPVLLVVEDNIELSGLLSFHFSDSYQVVVATNGADALSQLNNLQPDVIITDVMMPEMDGIEFCQHLKQNIETSHIPIAILSAKSATEARIEGLESGADVYLTKPFNMQELSLQIRNLLRRRFIVNEHIKSHGTYNALSNAIPERDRQFIERLTKVIIDNIENSNINIDWITKEIGISRTLLHIKLRKLANMSTTEFVNSLRLNHSKKLLHITELNISEVAYAVGFSDPNYFSKLFHKEFKITPSKFRKNENNI